jgi:hypothetical protein
VVRNIPHPAKVTRGSTAGSHQSKAEDGLAYSPNPANLSFPPYFFIKALKLSSRSASSLDMRTFFLRGSGTEARTDLADVLALTRVDADLAGTAVTPLNS